MTDHQVSLANIDGKKVKTFAALDRELTPMELFQCIVNKDQMTDLVQNHPKLKYALDHQKAAFKIQSLFRMVVIRKDYGRIKVLIKKVMVIQKQARIYLETKRWRQARRDRRAEIYKQFQVRQTNLIDNYRAQESQVRWEVHINSLAFEELKRLSLESFK